MFTQPLMYSIIKKTPNVLDKYSDQLVKEGHVTQDEVKVCCSLIVFYTFVDLQNFHIEPLVKSVDCEVKLELKNFVIV